MKTGKMGKDKTVAQVVYCLSRGGSERVGEDVAIGLKNLGYGSFVCALKSGGPIEEDLRANGIGYFIAGWDPRKKLSAILGIYGFFRKIRPRVVHTHHLTTLAYSFVGAILAGARIVHTEHDYYSISDPRSRFLLKLLSLFCARITAVSEPITEFLRDKVGIASKKLMTIHNGVDMGRFLKPAGSISKESLGFHGNAKIIGTIGRLEEEKDQETLIRAFACVTEMHKNVGLLIVGEGSRMDSLKTECSRLGISDKVVFYGLSNDIPGLLSLMDVFALTSLREGLPLSLLEAMAANVPVISTAVGSIPYLIKDGVTGLIVEPEKPQQLANAIIRVISDGGLSSSLRSSARRLVEERYDFKATLKAYIEAYGTG